MDEKKNSILIVDDQLLNIKVLSKILEHDYDVSFEQSGKACIEAAKQTKPDLILLDVIMPEMSGFEVIEEMKKDDDIKDIPIIFVTGLSKSEEEVRGFLLGAVDYINKPFSEPVVQARVRNQIRIVNYVREIQNLSITDALTGIGNRRYFNSLLHSEWARAKRLQLSIGFIILDIDHFKNFNDTHGHLNGDEALKNVAKVINASLSRATDKAARWGGEEFAVILPCTEPAGARKVAEDIRVAIENHVIPLDDGSTTRVTISVGVHSVIPDRTEKYTLDGFITDADKALYHAKKTGRNRVCEVDSLSKLHSGNNDGL
ncbi:MAG: diguanylate cyclase [Defluviitaleaceae bacterium]|nr:diguanylate cyclase [Defluviitaleaceae bacterium]